MSIKILNQAEVYCIKLKHMKNAEKNTILGLNSCADKFFCSTKGTKALAVI